LLSGCRIAILEAWTEGIQFCAVCQTLDEMSLFRGRLRNE
jgi:hypothetical protein